MSKARVATIFFSLIAVAVGAMVAVSFRYLEKTPPRIELGGPGETLAATGRITVQVRDAGSGVRGLEVLIRQGATSAPLLAERLGRDKLLKSRGPAELSKDVEFDARKARLKDGPAEIEVIATDFSFWRMLAGNQARLVQAVVIDTVAPRIQINHGQQYVNPGGSGIVVYTTSETPGRHGVEINGRFFPGFPLNKDRPNLYIAYFGLAWDTKALKSCQVLAADRAGNRGMAAFSPVLKKVADKFDRINISDGFLNAKLPEFALHYPELHGSPIEQYIFINNTIRDRNNAAIASLCSTPGEERRWTDRFLRMAGSPRAGFADQRSYSYQEQEIDQQVHLGVDIASTERVPIKAANGGAVIFTDYLGIYGNMVILDHGQGLFSLYSHLSGFSVNKGDVVDKGAVIGHSGATGMAGGDHLHFSILVHGVFVTPIEWWDQHWIDVNINHVLAEYGS